MSIVLPGNTKFNHDFAYTPAPALHSRGKAERPNSLLRTLVVFPALDTLVAPPSPVPCQKYRHC